MWFKKGNMFAADYSVQKLGWNRLHCSARSQETRSRHWLCGKLCSKKELLLERDELMCIFSGFLETLAGR